MNKQEYLSAIRVRIPKMPTEDMEQDQQLETVF